MPPARAPRARLHLHAGDRLDRPARARRRGAVRLRLDGREARSRDAVLLRSVGGAGAAVGRAARAGPAADGRRDRRPGAPGARRRRPRSVRGRGAAALVVAAVAGDPRRRDAGQRARRRARSDQRHHRLRRHEPHGARVRPLLRTGVAAGGARARRGGAARDAVHRRVPLGHPAGARGARGAAGPAVDAARHRRGAVRLAGEAPSRQRLPAGLGGRLWPLLAFLEAEGLDLLRARLRAGAGPRRRPGVDRASPRGVRPGAVAAHVSTGRCTSCAGRACG